MTLAVEHMHGAAAAFVISVAVHERFEEQTVWEGIVSIFALGGVFPKVCYAWSVPPEREGGKERFYAVLKTDAVNTPEKAVRSSIGADPSVGRR